MSMLRNMVTLGIDAGSRAVKSVVLEAETGRVLGRALLDQGVEQERLAREAAREALASAGLSVEQLAGTVATGYGRRAVEGADAVVTEITCHARGVRHACPEARTVIDIGGQDSKVIWLDGKGVRDFAMNDRCAAGTGRFLEIVAQRLETDLAGLGALAAGSHAPMPISSTCVVFAETEIVGLLASRAHPADVAAGIQEAVASRVATMAGRRIPEPVIFTGGVALVPGMRERLAEALRCEVALAPDPQYTGALGAALLAAERCG